MLLCKNSCVPPLFFRLIPMLSSFSTCSSVGLFRFTFPLYAEAMLFFCIPIFFVVSIPISSNFFLLIPDFFANVSIVSLSVNFDISTPIDCNILNVSKNSCILSLFFRLIPMLSSFSTCSSVGLFRFTFPLYAEAMLFFCIPIFFVVSIPISSNFFLLIPDLFANVSIVSPFVIFDISTPIDCNILNVSKNSCI